MCLKENQHLSNMFHLSKKTHEEFYYLFTTISEEHINTNRNNIHNLGHRFTFGMMHFKRQRCTWSETYLQDSIAYQV